MQKNYINFWLKDNSIYGFMMRKFWGFVNRNPDAAIYMYQPARLATKIREWRRHLPQVRPYYALKCNPMPQLVSDLRIVNPDMAFDCASSGEIRQLRQQSIHGHDMIYANPVKSLRDLQYAANQHVRALTIDSLEEWHKIVATYHNHPLCEPRVYLRVAVDDTHSTCRFNQKFGICRDYFDQIVRNLVRSPMSHWIEGLSFHIGSNCRSVEGYRQALQEMVHYRQQAKRLGLTLDTLNIGGGFGPDLGPGDVAQYFRNLPFKYYIGEPGRYLVHDAMDLYVPVIGVNRVKSRYYINDSVYGSFSCIMYDYARPDFQVYRRTSSGSYQILSKSQSGESKATIFGASCDSLDRITETISLPQLLVGDYLCFPNMGAYTYASTSDFNGLARPLIYVSGDEIEK